MLDDPEDPNDLNKDKTSARAPPPERGRFVKGTSGNPGGRSKKKRDDLDAKIIARCESKIPNSSNTIIDLVLNGAFKSAAKGDMKAVRTVIELYRDALRKRGQTIVSDDADLEAARRILDLDLRLFADLKDEPISTTDNPFDRDDDQSDR